MTRVLFFGRPADALGAETTLEIPPSGLTVAEVRATLAARSPEHAAALCAPDIRAAVNVRTVADDAHVPADAEVAFFSPFSGG